jgi:hypothetical protein
MSDKKVKNMIVLNGITLESTEAATQATTARVIVDTYFSDTLNLSCKYTTGGGETTNNAHIKVWGYIGVKSDAADIAADSTNWIQLGAHSITTGTATFVATIFTIAGASAATTYDAHFRTNITFSKIRVSAYEEGVATNKGTLTVVVSVQ